MDFRGLLRDLLATLGILAFLMFISAGCAEKPAETIEPSSSASNDDDDDDDSTSSSDDICSMLKGHNDIKSEYGTLVSAFCSQLNFLRKDGSVYTGGSPEIFEDKVNENGDETSMRLMSSMLVDTTPKSYYNMLRLQLYYPDKFGDDFNVASGVDVDTSKTSGASKSEGTVTFVYHKDPQEQDDDPVDYKATTHFVELKSDNIYVQATESDNSYEAQTILKLKGLIIINKKGSKTEVFSVSDQTYDNSGNHDSVLSKAKDALAEDQERQYENGGHAKDANSKF